MQLRVFIFALGLGRAFGWVIYRSGTGEMSAMAYTQDGSLVDENDPSYQMEPQLATWFEDPGDGPAERRTKDYWYPVTRRDKYLQAYHMRGVTVTFLSVGYYEIMAMKPWQRFDKGGVMTQIRGWKSGKIMQLTGEEKTILISYH